MTLPAWVRTDRGVQKRRLRFYVCDFRMLAFLLPVRDERSRWRNLAEHESVELRFASSFVLALEHVRQCVPSEVYPRLSVRWTFLCALVR